MIKKLFLNLSLDKKLIVMMILLSLILISATYFIYMQSEKEILKAIESQTSELTNAIKVGVEEVTATGTTDEARLEKYFKDLNTKGIKEISIISNADEIIASSNPKNIGEPISYNKKDLIIRAEFGQTVSEEGKTYNVIIPVIAENTHYGYIHLKINKEDFSHLMKIIAIKRIAATVFVFGLGIFISFILSRRYTKPIHDVVIASKRVAAGDLNQHLPVKGKDEIGMLSESFNYMVQKLKENRSLEERLREIEHLAGLGQLSRGIAHEIRNPLNFINLGIEYIAGKYSPNEKNDKEKFYTLIDGIKQEIQRLNKLVNDFLDYSKPLKLNIKEVKIDKLIEEVITLIWAKAESEGIEIIREYNHNDVEIKVDPDLFKSCILNIITNAFHAIESKHRDSTYKGILVIKTGAQNSNFVLSIKDNGIGVSQENLPKIFEPFFSTKQTGLGLGLPMTKRVIEEHGGKVEFISSYGNGSEVRLIIPFK